MIVISIDATRSLPFRGARSFLANADVKRTLGSNFALYVRPITHMLPNTEVSLSDSQTEGNQLRFYTKERALRGWRYIGHELALKFNLMSLQLSGELSQADADFFHALTQGGLNLQIKQTCDKPLGALDPESVRHLDSIDTIQDGAIAMPLKIGSEIDRLLVCGDSWSALSLAELVTSAAHCAPATSSGTATSMALAYGLQGRNEDAERLFYVWENAGGLDSARAKYSLAMMYARHHDGSRRDAGRAESYLQDAYHVLNGLPDTKAAQYERIFNRNGYALLLFRSGRFEEAAELLRWGIDALSATRWHRQVHHTVLLNNLGRVYAAMGQWQEAEVSLTSAVHLDPLFAEYHQDLASVLCDMGKFEEASLAAKRARDLDPAIPEVHEMCGYTFLELNDVSQALAAYQVAWELGSKSGGLALLRVLSERDDYVAVAEMADAVIDAQTASEDRVEAELIAIEARSFLGPKMDLCRSLEELANRYPDSPLLAENLALANINR